MPAGAVPLLESKNRTLEAHRRLSAGTGQTFGLVTRVRQNWRLTSPPAPNRFALHCAAALSFCSVPKRRFDAAALDTYFDGLYGCRKAWGEALARHYGDAHGLSAICLRLGAVNREDRPMSPRDFSVWCSQRDAVQVIERAIAAPASLRFGVFFAVSDNAWSHRDLEHARAGLGFDPQDRAEDYR
jgi:hypothetical protein